MRYFPKRFRAHVQDWQYHSDGSMSLNPTFHQVFLRGQPNAQISLDAESFDRDEEAQVLAWSGDWVKIRKENPVVEGWLRAKYLGAQPVECVKCCPDEDQVECVKDESSSEDQVECVSETTIFSENIVSSFGERSLVPRQPSFPPPSVSVCALNGGGAC